MCTQTPGRYETIDHLIRPSGEKRVAPRQAQKWLERAGKDWFQVFMVTKEGD